MVRCQECGEHVSADWADCRNCGVWLGGVSDGSDEGAEHREEGASEELVSDWEPSGGGLTRREMLGYGGGSALFTWTAIGAGWFIFIREPTGPEEDVVREYVAALDRAHFYTVDELFHEEAPVDPPTAAEFPDIQHIEMTVEETEVLERRTNVDEFDSVEELAFVRVEITVDSGMESTRVVQGMVVAKNEDGEWKMFEDTTE